MESINIPGDIISLSEQNRFIQAVQSGLSDVEQGRVLADDELDMAMDKM